MMRVVSIAIVSLLAASGAAATIRFERTTHDFGAIPSNQKQDSSWAYHDDGKVQVTSVVRLLRAPRPDRR